MGVCRERASTIVPAAHCCGFAARGSHWGSRYAFNGPRNGKHFRREAMRPLLTFAASALPMSQKFDDVLVDQGGALDSRYHPSAALRRQLNKVFPTHWSFLLGEVALYSFIVLVITGCI